MFSNDILWTDEIAFGLAHLLQLGSGANDSMFSAISACPNGEWGSPVTLAADDPVASAYKPCVESFGSSPFWGPSDSFVLLDHFLLEFGDFDEPLICGSEYEGGLAAPAMRIRVFDRLLPEE